jgi:hypothetical protein
MKAKFSAPVQTGPGAHPPSCTMGTGPFLGVKNGRGVTLTPHPPSSAVSHERVELNIYSTYGSYGLYRALVPVQGCPLSFYINPLNAELNPICHLLVLLEDLTFMSPCIVSIFQYTCMSNKMQCYTVY